MSVRRLTCILASATSYVLAAALLAGCAGEAGVSSGSASTAASTPGGSTSGSSGSSGSGSGSSGSGGSGSSGSSAPALMGAPLSTVDVSGWVRGFAYNPNTNTMYAVIPAWGTEANPSVGQSTNSPDGSLVVIDGATGSLETTVSVAPSAAAYAFTGSVTVDPTSNMVYISDETDDSVIAVNGATDAIVARIPVGTQPSGLAADPATGTVYVANSIDGTVSAIRESTNTVTATIVDNYGGTEDDGTGLAESVAIDSASGLVYIADSHYNTVTVISEKTNQVQAVWNVGEGAQALLVDSSNSNLYVANYFDSTISVLNDTTGVSSATITVGSGPASLALDPTTATLYVSDNGGANIAVVDLQTNSVVGESGLIEPGNSYTVGVNPTNHVVYVPLGLEELAYYQGVIN